MKCGRLASVTAVISGASTAAFVLLPQLRLGYQLPAARLALEAAGSLVALVTAFLVYGRLRRRTNLAEALLASALAVLAFSNFFFLTVPTVAGWAPDGLTIAAAPIARALGGLLFFLAAFIPRRKLRWSGRLVTLAVVPVIAVLGMTAGLLYAFSEHWPPWYAATVSRDVIARAAFLAHPLLFAFELMVALLYGLAAIGFLRRARRYGDQFLGWLAVAAVLAVASHVNYSLFPSTYSQSVLYVGDIFRFAFYVALMIGCTREIWSYWNALSEAAVLEERRRIARDLHDGLAQELAYIFRNLDLLAEDFDPDVLRRVRLAAERAQLESRRAISTLALPSSQALDVALADAAAQVAERFRIELELNLVPGVRLSASRAEAMVRIACEAIANAARHSGAAIVNLHLERDGPQVLLRVADYGRGFDVDAPREGFGLTVMAERARAVGGQLRVLSVPGRGSEVQVCM